MSAKYAKPYSAEDRAPKSVVFDLLTPPTAAEPDVHPALVSRATATLNIDSLHGRDTSGPCDATGRCIGYDSGTIEPFLFYVDNGHLLHFK
jgi:hypothetical protein